jgi:putative Mn2+ efflux pump MntP
MNLFVVILIAISLSMDAFSLSLAYGTLGLPKKDILVLSTIVGIYHFFMPLIGMYIGQVILNMIPISPNLIILLVLSIIGIQMIISSFNENKKVKAMNFIELLSFGLAVSLDSFSVGLGLRTIYSIPIICSIIFMISSFTFTYLGLKLGKKINDKLGQISTLLGGTMLIIIGFLYII